MTESRLDAAIRAQHERTGYVAFNESPSRRFHPPGAKAEGLAAAAALCGQHLHGTGPVGDRVGAEVSPWTGKALGITYDRASVSVMVESARQGIDAWVAAGPEERSERCLEMLDALAADLFRATWATQHTTGQSFMMAFAGNGANALDRGLEALARATEAMRSLPATAVFKRSFGAHEVTLDKRYEIRPRGLAVVFSCGSYPAWNAYPALFANLATGNPVLLKAHPDTILPMALAVQHCRRILSDHGFSEDLVQLVPDAWDDPVGPELWTHPAVRIVDFTGGQTFGDELVRSCRNARVYTETSGCNAGILHSVEELDPVLDAIATGFALFSGQMCTSLQNLYIPPVVPVGGVDVPRAEVVQRLLERLDHSLAAHGPAICGALGNERICRTIDAARSSGAPIVRDSGPLGDPAARTATPLLLQLAVERRGVAQREHFGPVGFVIDAPTVEAAVEAAAGDAGRFGAISSYLWSTDESVIEHAERSFFDAGASLGINLVHQAPIHFSAAHSDFHVTGLNPAGNATLSDLSFVADRFRVVQSKRER